MPEPKAFSAFDPLTVEGALASREFLDWLSELVERLAAAEAEIRRLRGEPA